jgi:hypothetical protein
MADTDLMLVAEIVADTNGPFAGTGSSAARIGPVAPDEEPNDVSVTVGDRDTAPPALELDQ